MSPPTVFLSAASDDLKDWREILHTAFLRAGCMVYTQDQTLGASAGDVLQHLRLHLDKSDFVIHVAGMAYGSEPDQPAFADHPGFQCSYTQFEYYYAHQKRKQVIALLCAEDFPYRAFTEKGRDVADRERRHQLQIAHRERVAKGRFTGTALEGHAERPLSESVADANKLLQAVAAAVGTIRDCSPANLTSARTELEALAGKRHDELLASVADLPRQVADELERRRLIKPVSEFKAEISRIDKYAPAQLIGREDELAVLNDAWMKVRKAESPRPHVLTFVALGGEGKTSVVAKWAAELAHQNWPGCDAAFAWSFYSQGTRDHMATSSALFLKEALTFFGNAEMARDVTEAYDNGRRLAQLFSQRKALLILDGLEPLQYAPTAPTPGELKDAGLAALLKGLAVTNNGMCVVTTRYSIPDLRAYWQTTAPEVKLTRLSREAGAALLRLLKVKGTQQELETVVDEVHGHALTLHLLGTYLSEAHAGDIRKRDLVDLKDADAEHGGHAFRVMDAYVSWFEGDGEKGITAVAMLRLLGLFDRPATADCIDALLRPPAIAELTEALVVMSEGQRNIVLARLEAAELLTVSRNAAGTLLSLDAHPLLRDYFAQHLRKQHADTCRAAHRRLYEHLCATTKEGDRPTAEDLLPLHQAVAHGCFAGLQHEACDKVYRDRIQRGREAYSRYKLGAFGSDLGAIACFFDKPWDCVSSALPEEVQVWLLGEAALTLRALGRLHEALGPARAGLEGAVRLENWSDACKYAENLSRLKLMLGNVAEAVRFAEDSVSCADRSGAAYLQVGSRTTCADALHQQGNSDKAEACFGEAETLHAADEPKYPLLYSWHGSRYCELLLAGAERAAWRRILDGPTSVDPSPMLDSCRAVFQRAEQMSYWQREMPDAPLLDFALPQLNMGRAALYQAILGGTSLDSCQLFIQTAVKGMRPGGATHQLPRGFLSRSWLRALTGMTTGPNSSQSDLDEAWEIAERCHMPLFMVDIHLHRARLFFREKQYPWTSPHQDLAAARKLMESCGYWRRKEEVEDAETVILNWRRE